MESLFGINGLMFWSQREIRLRHQFEDHFAAELMEILHAENPAWQFIQIDGPLLTPKANINPNYTNDDVWVQENPIDKSLEEEFFKWIRDTEISVIIDRLPNNSEPHISQLKDLITNDDDYEPHRPWVANIFECWLDNLKKRPTQLVLRPETTPSSYVYAQHLLNTHAGVKPPFVIWQTGKSFRREQDQVTKNMRLKEFYQQEFQCIYTADTMNDYHAAVLEPVRKMIGEMIGKPTRIVESDRLPSYSEITMDVEVDNGDKWMEVCSISRRTDFPGKVRFQAKKKIVEKDLLVLEISIGLDRCVYNFEQGR